MKKLIYFCLCMIVVFLSGCVKEKETGYNVGESETTEQPSAMYGESLGTVDFSVSCTEEALPHMERGLALLHHMTYEGAETAFKTASEVDPDCALSYWGQAMSYIHPLWSDSPTEAKFNRGSKLVQKALNSGEVTERENAYIDAVAAYFEPGQKQQEAPNLAAFEKGWAGVHQTYPDDIEAAAFYALAHLGTVDPADKSYSKQKKAGTIMKGVLARVSDHPAGHHYTIHAYDYPPLAKNALREARNYGTIAPDVPHALHMPTHIFTRLGLWDESVEWNKRSANAALNHPAGDAISLHYLHALDYLAYAYLQRGEDQKAKQIADSLQMLEGPFQVEVASPYTMAAVPARIALERQQWAKAAALQPRMSKAYPWDKFPAIEAITWFAKGLGAARSGDTYAAQKVSIVLDSLSDKAGETSAYWAHQVDIQRKTVNAWLQFAEGNRDEALSVMKQAAQMEASTEKHPVTPGEILPAHELLGDMLLEMGQYTQALVAYEKCLERSTNRLNSLYGAGRAAELAGDTAKAALYNKQLVELAEDADTEIEKLEHARKFVKVN